MLGTQVILNVYILYQSHELCMYLNILLTSGWLWCHFNMLSLTQYCVINVHSFKCYVYYSDLCILFNLYHNILYTNQLNQEELTIKIVKT